MQTQIFRKSFRMKYYLICPFLCLLDPPRINGSGFPTEVSVVVNHVLELVCQAEGIPVPILTWVKDGRPLPQTESLRLLQGGEVLRISSAQVRYFGISILSHLGQFHMI